MLLCVFYMFLCVFIYYVYVLYRYLYDLHWCSMRNSYVCNMLVLYLGFSIIDETSLDGFSACVFQIFVDVQTLSFPNKCTGGSRYVERCWGPIS